MIHRDRSRHWGCGNESSRQTPRTLGAYILMQGHRKQNREGKAAWWGCAILNKVIQGRVLKKVRKIRQGRVRALAKGIGTAEVLRKQE